MSKQECASWITEISDDSLKELFIADSLYSVGSSARAVAHLESQTRERLPLIESQAKRECNTERLCYNPTKMLQANLEKVKVMMIKELPYVDVHREVMKIDKRFALPGYRAFCACTKR